MTNTGSFGKTTKYSNMSLVKKITACGIALITALFSLLVHTRLPLHHMQPTFIHSSAFYFEGEPFIPEVTLVLFTRQTLTCLRLTRTTDVFMSDHKRKGAGEKLMFSIYDSVHLNQVMRHGRHARRHVTNPTDVGIRVEFFFSSSSAFWEVPPSLHPIGYFSWQNRSLSGNPDWLNSGQIVVMRTDSNKLMTIACL